MMDIMHEKSNSRSMEHGNSVTKDDFRKALKPIVFSLKMFGLFFEKSENLKGIHRVLNNKTYCVVTLVVLWINVLRYIPAFFVGFDFKETFTAFRLLFTLWLFLGTLNATIVFHGCRKVLPQLCHTWSTMQCSEAYIALHLDKHVKTFRKRVLIWTILAWSALGFNVVTSFILALGPFPKAREIYGTVMSNPAPASILSVCLIMLPMLYSTAAWVFPLVYQIIFSTTMAREFETISKALDTELKKTTRGVPRYLEEIRKIHNQICRLVDYIDKLMSLWIMNAYITNIPLSCFILYTLVNSDLDVLSFCIEVMWMLLSIIYVCTVSILSSNVTVKAHSPVEHIHDIDLKGATPEQLGELNLFLAKLNGPTIGFTAMGLITVTKEVLLTLAGLYLTYFFLLMQFKI